MLQAPSSQLSRVCGHGHIKKFWLMQTQKESQTFDSKNNITVSSSSPPRHASMLSKAFDCSHWSPARISGFEDAAEKLISSTTKNSISPVQHNTDMPVSGDSEMDGHDGDLRITSQHGDTSSSSSRSLSSASGSAFEKKPSLGAMFNTEAADQADSLQSDESVKSDVHVPSFMADSPPSTTCVVHFRRKHQHGEHAGLSRVRTEAKSSSSPSSSQAEPNCEDEADKSDGEKKPSKLLQTSSNDDLRSCRDTDDASQNGTNGALGEKSLKADHDPQNPVLKACTLCGTTKTPMWRSGPQGPKSLCNACGIRFKKYRSFPGQGDSVDTALYSCSKFMSRPQKRKQNTNIEASKSQEVATKSSVVSDVSRQQKKSKWQQLVSKRDASKMREDLNEDSEAPWSSELLKVKQESSEKMEGIVSWKYSGSGGSALLKNGADKDLTGPWKYAANPTPLKKIYGYSPIQSKLKKMESMDEHHSRNRFAKDEEEAAVLLMHLSCGLVY